MIEPAQNQAIAEMHAEARRKADVPALETHTLINFPYAAPEPMPCEPGFTSPYSYNGPPWRLIVVARWRTAMRGCLAPTEPAPAPRSTRRPCSATGGFG